MDEQLHWISKVFPFTAFQHRAFCPDFAFARKIAPDLIHVVGQVGGVGEWVSVLRCGRPFKLLCQIINHFHHKKDRFLIHSPSFFVCLLFYFWDFFSLKPSCTLGGNWSNFDEDILVKLWHHGTPPGGISEPVPLTFVSHSEFRAFTEFCWTWKTAKNRGFSQQKMLDKKATVASWRWTFSVYPNVDMDTPKKRKPDCLAHLARFVKAFGYR